MHKIWLRRLLLSAGICLSIACFEESVPAATPNAGPLANEAFKELWFDGNAELSRYELKQSRYGEERTGDAVLIFVTEDFNPKLQVKADQPDQQSIPVLKLNFTKKFQTGIYPYSIMTSSFYDLRATNDKNILKVTTSVQEWCGHTFLQINQHDQSYVAQGFSYFESEGDNKHDWSEGYLEEELWTQLRIDPRSVPTGKFKMLPAGETLRLNHLELNAVKAEGILTEEQEHFVYSLRYRELGRTLSIRVQKKFPYFIDDWTETVRGDVTQATRTHTKRLPYWQHNHEAGAALRPQLGLTP